MAEQRPWRPGSFWHSPPPGMRVNTIGIPFPRVRCAHPGLCTLTPFGSWGPRLRLSKAARTASVASRTSQPPLDAQPSEPLREPEGWRPASAPVLQTIGTRQEGPGFIQGRTERPPKSIHRSRGWGRGSACTDRAFPAKGPTATPRAGPFPAPGLKNLISRCFRKERSRGLRAMPTLQSEP